MDMEFTLDSSSVSLHLPNFIPFSDESDDAPTVLLYLCAAN